MGALRRITRCTGQSIAARQRIFPSAGRIRHLKRALSILRAVHSADPSGGGVIEAVIQGSKCHIEQGHEVEVATLDEPGNLERTCEGIALHPLGPACGGYGYSGRLVRWLKRNVVRFDFVVIDGIWQYHGLAVRCALRNFAIPYGIFPHGMLDPWFQDRYPIKHLKKLLYWNLFERRNFAQARMVFYTSQEEMIKANRSYSIPAGPSHEIVGLGIANVPSVSPDLREGFLREHPYLRDRRILLFLGRIHEKKGIDLLIAAFGRVMDCSPGAGDSPRPLLVVVGPCSDDHYLTQLKLQAEKHCPADSVTWVGMLRGDLKWGALQSADAFILPSHQENFGIAVVEALASGTPVLVSKGVDIWHEIVSEGAGFAEDDSAQGCEQLIRRWLDSNDRDWQKMRDSAIPCFRRRFAACEGAGNLIAAIRRVFAS